MTPRFDPTRAIVYDLARGQLRDDEGAQRLNLPYQLVARLCEHAGAEAAVDFARSIGHEAGRRVQERLGKVADAGVASWAEHLGGHLALLGLGNLQVERWGKALVVRVTDHPDGAADFVSQVIEGALSRATGHELRAVSFPDDASVACLVVSPQTADKVRELAAGGQGLGQVVESLHKGAA